MTRAASPEFLAAAKAPTVRPFLAVDCAYPDGAVRLTSLPAGQPITIDGQQYHGAGALGSISTLSEGAEGGGFGFTLTLSGIPAEFHQYLREQDVQGRAVTVRLGFVDDQWRVTAHQVITVGRMDTQDVTAGAEAQVVVTCEAETVDWERARVRRCTDIDQTIAHPGDRFFKFMAAMENMALVFGRS
jgi:hypothetical protein